MTSCLEYSKEAYEEAEKVDTRINMNSPTKAERVTATQQNARTSTADDT
jgi:hypothetical protein